MSSLPPCPCCSGAAIPRNVLAGVYSDRVDYYVECSDCRMRGPMQSYDCDGSYRARRRIANDAWYLLGIRARNQLITRATEIATTSTPRIPRALDIAKAAIASNVQAKWMTLQAELNAWQRVHAIHGPAAAAPRFDAIATAIGADVRWEVPVANSKHTPGPWHVHERASTTVMGPEENPSAVTSCGGGNARTIRECQAHARLIASAPQLLEALTQAVERAEDREFPDRSMFDRWYSALAAARGES